MKAIFNSRLIETDKIDLKCTNRAFCYGDGIFETIVTGHDRINLIGFHLNRMRKACAVLQITPPDVSGAKLLKMIEELSSLNHIKGNVRSRLHVWRKEGGLYTPESGESEFLLTVNNQTTDCYTPQKTIGISQHHTVHYHSISFAKTMSALPYVLAGLEKKEKGWDDIILLDSHGNLAETHSSNLYWLKNGQLYTPSLKTGCIEGVMRRCLLEKMQVSEVLEKADSLLEADSIFTTNASGIRYFTLYNGKPLAEPTLYLADLLKQLRPL